MEDIEKTMNSKTDCKGAQILGFHMEGPYINVKYKGAQNEKFIKAPDFEEFKKLPNVKMVTIAPEVEGSMEFIKQAKDLCVVSLGHTDTTYDIAMEAIKNGANCLTHSFNAMPPLHHRNPGLLGAGMETGIYAQIICDGLHIHKAVILAMYKIFGTDRLVLISDSMRATGMSDGEYEFGGQPIEVKNGVARTMEGAIAGSTTNLWACVNKAVEFGIPFEDAVKMATETPATMIGVNKGQLKEGFDADFVVLNDDRTINGTYIAGNLYQ
jgi:N-acetylglucosamine-6-phosphate deacetylase